MKIRSLYFDLRIAEESDRDSLVGDEKFEKGEVSHAEDSK